MQITDFGSSSKAGRREGKKENNEAKSEEERMTH
jgi:hypothetical protein